MEKSQMIERIKQQIAIFRAESACYLNQVVNKLSGTFPDENPTRYEVTARGLDIALDALRSLFMAQYEKAYLRKNLVKTIPYEIEANNWVEQINRNSVCHGDFFKKVAMEQIALNAFRDMRVIFTLAEEGKRVVEEDFKKHYALPLEERIRLANRYAPMPDQIKEGVPCECNDEVLYLANLNSMICCSCHTKFQAKALAALERYPAVRMRYAHGL